MLGLSRAGSVFSLSLVEVAQSELLTFLRSFSCAESVASTMDLAKLELILFLQSHARPEVAAPAFGMSCLGSVFVLSVIETAWIGLFLSSQSSSRPASCVFAPGCIQPGSASLLRSSGKISSSALALDLLRLESLLLPRGSHRPDSAVLLVGLSRIDFVSFLLVVSSSRLGLFLPTRSLAQPGVVVSALGFSHVGPLPFPRSSGQSGPVMSACSQACSGSPLPVLDFACSDPVLLLRSSGRSSLSLPALNHCKAGAAVLLQSYAISGPVPLVFGLGRLGLLLFAPDSAHSGFMAPLQSLACLGSALPATRQK